MLANLGSIENLSGPARARARDYVTKTVNPALVEKLVAEGWTVDKSNKKSIRLRRVKPHGVLLEDRVWTLFHRMQFPILSMEGGAQLVLDPKDSESPKSQIDVVGVDDEVAVAIECKSSESHARRPQFQHELGKHALIRDRFAASVRAEYETPHKRQIVLAMFLWNISLSENDESRAKEANGLIFDEHDLTYYESLTSHIGPA